MWNNIIFCIHYAHPCEPSTNRLLNLQQTWMDIIISSRVLLR